MNPDCIKSQCLFQHEEGCLDCKVCVYCGSNIDVMIKPEELDNTHSLMDAGETTVPACKSCGDSKGSTRLKIWLKCLREKDPAYFSLILYHNIPLQNTVSLIVKRVARETNFNAD